MSSRARSSSSPVVADYARFERRVCTALQHSRSPLARQLPSDLIHLIVAFLWSPLTSVSRQLDNPRQRALWTPSLAICTGWIHGDTQQYDEWTSELRSRVMAGWRLRAIDCYGDRYVNGFGFTYNGPSGETWISETRKGSHHRPSMSRLQLSSGERIVQVAVRLSKWMECCVFETSAGRRFQVGGRGSRWAPKEKHASEWTHAGVTQLLLMPQPQPQPSERRRAAASGGGASEYEALAFTYGIGGHVHNLGVYYQRVTSLVSSADVDQTTALCSARNSASAVPVSAVSTLTAPIDNVSSSSDEWSDTSCLLTSLPLLPPARQPLLSS